MPEPATSAAWRRRSVWLLVPVLALAGHLAALTVEHSRGPLIAEGVLSDSFDVGIYFQRAQFYPNGSTPYVDVPSEYPVLATLGFVAPYFFAARPDPPSYGLIWGRLMGLAFLATVVVVFLSRAAWGHAGWPVALMASPTLLYFTTNRFDILPALACCLSLYALQRNRTLTAYLLLGIGVHVKWYPAVLFPVYLAYHLEQQGRFASLHELLRSPPVRSALVFLAVALGIAGACIVAFGLDGFLVPYQFHAERGAQFFNAYWLAERVLRATGSFDAVRPALDTGFLLAQVAFGAVVLWLRPKSLHAVFQYSVLAIVLFVAFAKVDSPQWILWYAPIVLTFARRNSTLIALASLTLLNYGVFPLAFRSVDAFHAGRVLDVPTAFQAFVFLKDVAMVATVVFLLREPPTNTAT